MFVYNLPCRGLDLACEIELVAMFKLFDNRGMVPEGVGLNMTEQPRTLHKIFWNLNSWIQWDSGTTTCSQTRYQACRGVCIKGGQLELTTL